MIQDRSFAVIMCMLAALILLTGILACPKPAVILPSRMDEAVAYEARFIDCYDGDTCDFDILLGIDVVVRQRVRLCGIDAPEIRGEEKQQGKVAHAFVLEMLMAAQTIILQVPQRSNCQRSLRSCDVRGKYGRLLADVIADEQSVNRALLQAGLAELSPGPCVF